MDAVRPGLIEPEMHASGGAPTAPAGWAPDPARPRRLAGGAVEAIDFLLSDAAGCNTGSHLKIARGWTNRPRGARESLARML